MKKEDFIAWKGMEITKQVFRLIAYRQEAQNKEFLNGACVRPTNDESMNLYNQLVGGNRILNFIQDLEFEDLVEAEIEDGKNGEETYN